MARIGIDPGLDGCVARIDSEGHVAFSDTPIFKSTEGSRQPDPMGMLRILREIKRLYPDVRAVLELVQAYPKNGSIGNFKMGQGYGLWQMALAAVEIPHVMVRPQRWKKAVLDGAPKTPQGEAAVAARLYPSASEHFRGPKGGLKEGRVDALLIAHYGILSGA